MIEWAAVQVDRPFAWGETDCASLARAALKQCFGEDVAPEVPEWHSKREAARVLRAHPPLQILEALGAERTAIGFARAGDIISLPVTEDLIGDIALGVWTDSACLISSQRAGVELLRAGDVPPESVAYSLWEIAVTHG